jgi:hypothetical protein
MQKCWPDEGQGGGFASLAVTREGSNAYRLSIAGAPIDRLRMRENRARGCWLRGGVPTASKHQQAPASSRSNAGLVELGGVAPVVDVVFVVFTVEKGQPPESRRANDPPPSEYEIQFTYCVLCPARSGTRRAQKEDDAAFAQDLLASARC